MNMAAPLMIRAEILVKQPAINTVMPPKLVRQGSRIIPNIRNAESHLEDDGKHLQASYIRSTWMLPPWLRLQMGVLTESSSILIVLTRTSKCQ